MPVYTSVGKGSVFPVPALEAYTGGFSFTHSSTWCWIEVSVQHEASAAVPLVASDQALGD